MNNKRLSTTIALTLIILLVILIGIFYYIPDNEDSSDSPRITEGQVTPLETKRCEIDIQPDNDITLRINQTYKLHAYNYQGSMMDVAWISKDPLVASFNEHLGDQVRIIAYNEGTTEIVVTDRTMGEDCTDYIFVRVEE